MNKTGIGVRVRISPETDSPIKPKRDPIGACRGLPYRWGIGTEEGGGGVRVRVGFWVGSDPISVAGKEAARNGER